MKAMILAAGRGKRMLHLTKNSPKPLLKIGAETLLERQIKSLKKSGVKELMINLSYKSEQIKEYLKQNKNFNIDIKTSYEKDALETAGGILKVLEFFDAESPFIVTNADIYTDFDYKKLINSDVKDYSGLLVLVENPCFKEKGDFSLQNNLVVHGSEFTFSGIGLYKKKLFEKFLTQERLALKPVLDQNINEKKLCGFLHKGLWMDVGTPERLKLANEF